MLALIIIISAGAAPGLALLTYFYLKDDYEPEPVLLVLRMFFFGMLIVIPVMFAQYVVDTEFFSPRGMESFLISLMEEVCKWSIVYIMFRNPEFDEPYDGIVYSTSVALGFATLENVLYLHVHGVSLAFTRAVLPVSGHALFGVIMGFYFGKAKFYIETERRCLFLAFFLPFILHGSYDYILLMQQKWIYFMLPFMIFLWVFAVWKVKQMRMDKYSHYARTLYNND